MGEDSVSQVSFQENKNNPAITQLGQNNQPNVKDKVEVRNQKSRVSPVSLFIRSSIKKKGFLKAAVLDSLKKPPKDKNKENGKRNISQF